MSAPPSGIVVDRFTAAIGLNTNVANGYSGYPLLTGFGPIWPLDGWQTGPDPYDDTDWDTAGDEATVKTSLEHAETNDYYVLLRPFNGGDHPNIGGYSSFTSYRQEPIGSGDTVSLPVVNDAGWQDVYRAQMIRLGTILDTEMPSHSGVRFAERVLHVPVSMAMVHGSEMILKWNTANTAAHKSQWATAYGYANDASLEANIAAMWEQAWKDGVDITMQHLPDDVRVSIAPGDVFGSWTQGFNVVEWAAEKYGDRLVVLITNYEPDHHTGSGSPNAHEAMERAFRGGASVAIQTRGHGVDPFFNSAAGLQAMIVTGESVDTFLPVVGMECANPTFLSWGGSWTTTAEDEYTGYSNDSFYDYYAGHTADNLQTHLPTLEANEDAFASLANDATLTPAGNLGGFDAVDNGSGNHTFTVKPAGVGRHKSVTLSLLDGATLPAPAFLRWDLPTGNVFAHVDMCIRISALPTGTHHRLFAPMNGTAALAYARIKTTGELELVESDGFTQLDVSTLDFADYLNRWVRLVFVVRASTAAAGSLNDGTFAAHIYTDLGSETPTESLTTTRHAGTPYLFDSATLDRVYIGAPGRPGAADAYTLEMSRIRGHNYGVDHDGLGARQTKAAF